MGYKFNSTGSREEYFSDGTNAFVLTNSGLVLNISGAGLSLDFNKLTTSVDTDGFWVIVADDNTTLQLLYSETVYPSAAALAAAIVIIISTTLSATVNLDFPNTLAGATADLAVAVPGAVDGNGVIVGVPLASMPGAGNVAGFIGFVSAPDTVTVRFWNGSVGAIDPPAGIFQITVIKS